MFKNTVLRKIHGPIRELEENASWFELICMIKCRLRWVGHAARTGNRGGFNRVLVGKYWGKRLL